MNDMHYTQNNYITLLPLALTDTMALDTTRASSSIPKTSSSDLIPSNYHVATDLSSGSTSLTTLKPVAVSPESTTTADAVSKDSSTVSASVAKIKMKELFIAPSPSSSLSPLPDAADLFTAIPINLTASNHGHLQLDSSPSGSGESSDNSLTESLAPPKALNLAKGRMKASALRFPPCDICGGKASGLHYGSNTCEACKNFFRRYLLRAQGYICTKQGNCVISCENRGNCSACRLKKCLDFGMSKDKSKMGRYSYSRRTETIQKVRKLEGKDGGKIIDEMDGNSCSPQIHVKELSPVNTSNISPEKDANYSMDVARNLTLRMFELKPWGDKYDTDEARQEKMKEHYGKYLDRVKMFGPLRAMSMEDYQNLLHNFGIDIDGQFELLKRTALDWDLIVGKYCSFVKHIPEFDTLSYKDQANLLKASHFDFFTILMHSGYNSEYRVFLDLMGVAYHQEEAADKFFTRTFIEEMGKLDEWIQKICLTDTEKALLLSLCSVSTDICKLENYEHVEKIQTGLTGLLMEELNSRMDSSSANKRFAKFIDCMLKLRQLSVIYYKEYKAICQDEMIASAVPHIDILCLPDEHCDG